MKAVAVLAAQGLEYAATRRLAASQLAHARFAGGECARSRTPGETRVSRLATVICSDGDRKVVSC